MLIKDEERVYCLILSGGGAKGIYHIGVWDGLTELGIRTHSYFGNSIGAVVAAFLAQGNIKGLHEAANNLKVNTLFRLPEDMIKEGKLSLRRIDLSQFTKLHREFLRGIDTSPLRNLLKKNLDEAKIRKGGKDFGVTVFSIQDFKAEHIFLEDMEEGTLVDYIMASTAIPGFKRSTIHGKTFLDGGLVDNIPFEMALKRGYRDIIVVDISGLGVNKRPRSEGTRTIYIKNSIDMGGMFDFDRAFLQNYRILGYLDTLKTFGVLKGIRYFFQPDPSWERQMEKYLASSRAREILDYYNPKGEGLSLEKRIRCLLPEGQEKQKDYLYCLADCLGSIFNMERIKKYSMEEFMTLVEERQNKEESLINGHRQRVSLEGKDSLFKRLEVLFNGTKVWDKKRDSPYYDYTLTRELLGQKYKTLHKALYSYHPELKAGLLALGSLGERKE